MYSSGLAHSIHQFLYVGSQKIPWLIINRDSLSLFSSFSQYENAGKAGGEDYGCLSQGIIAPVIGKHGGHRVRRSRLLYRFLEIPGRDVETGRRAGISPVRHILGSVEKDDPGNKHADKG